MQLCEEQNSIFTQLHVTGILNIYNFNKITFPPTFLTLYIYKHAPGIVYYVYILSLHLHAPIMTSNCVESKIQFCSLHSCMSLEF